MDVLFVTSIAPIVRDADAARLFYRDALGLSFEGGDGDYVLTQKLEGTQHFGPWPLAEAAERLFRHHRMAGRHPGAPSQHRVRGRRRRRRSHRAQGQGLSAHPTKPAPSRGARSLLGCGALRGRSSPSLTPSFTMHAAPEPRPP